MRSPSSCFPEFGFIQQEFTGMEQIPEYQFEIAYLSGTVVDAFAVTIVFSPGTAGKYL